MMEPSKPWRGTQAESRARYLEQFDQDEVARYEAWIDMLGDADDEACLADIGRHFTFTAGMSVLDVGAGTGVLCRMLNRLPGLELTAMEPAAAMVARLRSLHGHGGLRIVERFCDSPDDVAVFPEQEFDVIISRQLVNGLFDPLAAFRNWRHWLKDRGTVIILDGLYERSAWTGKWENEVDTLPLSACQSMAMGPYLLEKAGFTIAAVGRMTATNAMPSTRTDRYIVVAQANQGGLVAG